MKKFILSFLTLSLLVLTSCSKEEVSPVMNDEVVPAWRGSSSMMIQSSDGFANDTGDFSVGVGSDITDPNEEPEEEGS